MEVSGKPVGAGGRDTDLGNPLSQTRFEAISQRADPLGLPGEFGYGEFRRDRERGGSGGILSARPQPALLAAAVQQRLDPRLARDDQRTHAHRPAELVRGDAQGHQPRAARTRDLPQCSKRQRNVAESPDRIHMQRHVRVDADGGCRDQGLQRADFVVRREEGRHGGISPADRALPPVEIEARIVVDRHPLQVGDLMGMQPRQRVQRRVVLGEGRDDRSASGGLAARAVQPRDAEVHRLGAA